MLDLRDFIAQSEALVASHAFEQPGAYRRWNWDDGSGRDLGLNPYGCADAANILYTLGLLPQEPSERQSWIGTLQSLQDPETGLFEEQTHHIIHTTAHCIAAMELFDARPEHPLIGLNELKSTEGLCAFLDSLAWRTNPWRESHRGAGFYAALVIAREVDLAWEDAYFAWLWEHSDPKTGFIGGPDLPRVEHGGVSTMVPHMAGTFHYLFNMEWAHRPLRYPDRLIDSCLAMLAEDVFPLGRKIGFAEIDWIYCVNRSLRQSGHRFRECKEALEHLGSRLGDFVLSLDPTTDEGLNDIHMLFGTLCAFAELQQALPGFVRTERPLKLVLDRRPFI